jgi:hypothetical protein
LTSVAKPIFRELLKTVDFGGIAERNLGYHVWRKAEEWATRSPNAKNPIPDVNALW